MVDAIIDGVVLNADIAIGSVQVADTPMNHVGHTMDSQLMAQLAADEKMDDVKLTTGVVTNKCKTWWR